MSLPTLSNLLMDSAQLEAALLAADGEINEQIEELLAVREIKVPQKIEQYKYRIDRFRLMADYLKSQREQLAKLEKSFNSAADRIEDGLLNAMDAHELQFLDGIQYEVTIKQNPESVVIDNAEMLSTEYTKTKIEPDKTAIKKAIQSGVEVSGARLERGRKIQFKPMAKKAVAV